MVMVTDRELDPPLQAIEAKPLTVGVHVAVEVTCTEEWGFAVVTTTALAVAHLVDDEQGGREEPFEFEEG